MNVPIEQSNSLADLVGRINAEHRLRFVQAELRCITGAPIKDEADRLRRMALWRELDARARDEARP
jgi:hypothetical protein